ncbi:sodium/calcium exchanger family protein / calcium-binding EF hand family protein [Zea mays]|uniref:Sodium/calcium exchanger family protein / calcium-binding EF hand family protein n=1 Tax=Zea mays TaxID=4577 RepID=A0A1D6H5N3_MAIZE|nr:sodium/calcium exchanger family protein / calcium-binding EF hand family protein [Zea mays]
MPTRLPLRLLLLVLAIAGAAHGRRGISFSDDDRSLLLAGSSDEVAAATSVLRLPSAAGEDPAPEACEMTYGFLPCTDTAPGNLFLVLAYGLLMFKAATYLSAGSELLLEVLGPGVVGGLFLPILGALPDAMLILGATSAHYIVWVKSSKIVHQVSAMCLVSFAFLVFQPWVQRRRLEYAGLKHVMSGLLRHAQTHIFGRLLREDGTPNIPVIEKLFCKIDLDNDGKLERGELQAFILGVKFEDVDLDSDLAVDQVMADFDTSHNSVIEKGEFIDGILRWLEEAKRSVATSGSDSRKFLQDFHTRTRDERSQLLGKDDEDGEAIENPTWTSFKAILLLLLGTAMAAAFADPLVDAVHGFSNATSIPSFFISFIAMPLATNSSEAVSAIIFASRKKQRTLSLTFSEVYGAVTMNNTLCLAVFLGLVYVRGLTWDFSSEVLIIFSVCTIMGLFTSFRTDFPLWTCVVAYLLYPLSLVVVYVLDFKFGWS